MLEIMECVEEPMTLGSSSCGQTPGDAYVLQLNCGETNPNLLSQDLCYGRGAGGRSACNNHPGAEEEGGQGVDPGGGGRSQKTYHCQVSLHCFFMYPFERNSKGNIFTNLILQI